MNALTVITPEDLEDAYARKMWQQVRLDRAARANRDLPPIQPVKIPKATPRRSYSPLPPTQARVRMKAAPKLEDLPHVVVPDLPRKEKPRMGAKPKPVVIKGIEYPSAREAALAFGITEQTIRYQIKKGRGDRIGSGSGPVKKAVTINGVTYESLSAAGRALGVHKNTITRRILVAEAGAMAQKSATMDGRRAKGEATRAKIKALDGQGLTRAAMCDATGLCLSAVRKHLVIIRADQREARA